MLLRRVYYVNYSRSFIKSYVRNTSFRFQSKSTTLADLYERIIYECIKWQRGWRHRHNNNYIIQLFRRPKTQETEFKREMTCCNQVIIETHNLLLSYCWCCCYCCCCEPIREIGHDRLVPHTERYTPSSCTRHVKDVDALSKVENVKINTG
jgi:hypothetical protein